MWDRLRFPNILMLRCVIKMRMMILIMWLFSLSFHYKSEMRDKESYDAWEIVSLQLRSWKTGWLFPLYPCHQSQGMNCLRFPPGYPSYDHITCGKCPAYLGIWITKGLLYISTSRWACRSRLVMSCLRFAILYFVWYMLSFGGMFLMSSFILFFTIWSTVLSESVWVNVCKHRRSHYCVGLCTFSLL
jgi:hypothetical protein